MRRSSLPGIRREIYRDGLLSPRVSHSHDMSSPARFIKWLRRGQARPKSRRARGNAELAQKVRRIHTASGEVYSSPKVWKELQGRGSSCGQHRVARLMKQEGLQGIPSKKGWRRTHKASHRPAGVTNHLARDFAAAKPNTKWVTDTDITYIPTAEGWLYLTVVLDLYSRQVIGWSMQPQQKCGLML